MRRKLPPSPRSGALITITKGKDRGAVRRGDSARGFWAALPGSLRVTAADGPCSFYRRPCSAIRLAVSAFHLFMSSLSHKSFGHFTPSKSGSRLSTCRVPGPFFSIFQVERASTSSISHFVSEFHHSLLLRAEFKVNTWKIFELAPAFPLRHVTR